MNDYISVKDTLPLNYHKYLYRVAGINHFGEISQYSSNIVVTGIDLTPPAQVSFISVENTSGANVKIKWQKKLKEPDMIGFVIGRSQSIKGPFEPLQKQFLPINATEYVDNNAEPFGTNYYVVSAIDTAGNAAISLPAYAVMKDEAPPATPTGLKGSMDSTGVIKMTWNKNTEPDLEGYLVYAANQKDHVFTPITTGFLLDEFFADSTTLQTLTKYKYYKVVAFDKARKASPYSEILTVKRPDKVAPVAAVFNNYSVSDSTANISWIPSSSDDALKQILSRKEDGHAEYKEIKTFDNKTRSYFDSEVIPGHWYSYIIQTIDESGLKSEKSFPLRIKPYVTGIKPNVKQLKIVLLEDHKSVNVSWSPASNENQRVLIYRKINNGDMQLVEGINNPIKEFKDKIYAKGIYYYATKVKYNDGGESLLSEFLKTEVN
jgi:hypothetical protein